MRKWLIALGLAFVVCIAVFVAIVLKLNAEGELPNPFAASDTDVVETMQTTSDGSEEEDPLSQDDIETDESIINATSTSSTSAGITETDSEGADPASGGSVTEPSGESRQSPSGTIVEEAPFDEFEGPEDVVD